MDLHRYRLNAAEGVAKKTLACRLSAVRAFLRWVTSVEAVDPDPLERIMVPRVERARTRYLDNDTVTAILDYLERFRYASRDHVSLLLFCRTGAGLGAILGLDVEDYHADDGEDGAAAGVSRQSIIARGRGTPADHQFSPASLLRGRGQFALIHLAYFSTAATTNPAITRSA